MMEYLREGPLLIRDMKTEDGPILTAEERAQGWHTEVEKFEMRLRDAASGRAVALTAEYDGCPAGYIHVYWQGYPGPEICRDWPEIVDFGVLEKYRRRGIGGRLMDVAEGIAAQRSDTVYLAVGLHNGFGSAQRMYVKRGYVPDGSGAWYNGKVCTPYDTVYTNDDDLQLYLYKRLKKETP